MQKHEYFDYIDGSYKPQDDCISRIETFLAQQLHDISLLRNLIVWENIIHQKTAETITEFSSFYPINKDWDKNCKSIIYRLAKAVMGTDDIIIANDQLKLAKAFMNLNTFLFDKVESEIENLQLGHIENIPGKDNDAPVTPLILSKINSTLHTSLPRLNAINFQQGNIYQIPDEDNCINRITWEKLFNPANPTKLAEIRNSVLLVQLDLTPVCDYSQDKGYIRLVYGVIVNRDFEKHFKSAFFYKTPVMLIDDKEKFFVFDFRYIKTVSKEFMTRRKISPLIRLRKEICTDIQSQLANQVNRPGISNV